MKKRTLILIIIFSIVFVIFTSCKTIERIEYVDKYHTIERSDTLIQIEKDSVFVNQYQKGDTVFHVKHIEKIKFRDKIIVKNDTVEVIEIKQVTEIKEVVPDWCYKLIVAFVVILLIMLIYFYVIKRI